MATDNGGSGYMESLVLISGISTTPKDARSAQVAVVELCDYDADKSKEILEILGIDRRVNDGNGEGD